VANNPGGATFIRLSDLCLPGASATDIPLAPMGKSIPAGELRSEFIYVVILRIR
jgi:hypothetical protein